MSNNCSGGFVAKDGWSKAQAERGIFDAPERKKAELKGGGRVFVSSVVVLSASGREKGIGDGGRGGGGNLNGEEEQGSQVGTGTAEAFGCGMDLDFVRLREATRGEARQADVGKPGLVTVHSDGVRSRQCKLGIRRGGLSRRSQNEDVRQGGCGA